MAKPKLLLARVSSRHQSAILKKTCQCLGRTPEERQEKIQSLSHAIRSNSYRIDCRTLADCLIASLVFGIL
jgi:anti-sigma28 factor (negative regulator of flagellin synthesis)